MPFYELVKTNKSEREGERKKRREKREKYVGVFVSKKTCGSVAQM